MSQRGAALRAAIRVRLTFDPAGVGELGNSKSTLCPGGCGGCAGGPLHPRLLPLTPSGSWRGPRRRSDRTYPREVIQWGWRLPRIPPASAVWRVSFNLTSSIVAKDTTGFSRVEFQF